MTSSGPERGVLDRLADVADGAPPRASVESLLILAGWLAAVHGIPPDCVALFLSSYRETRHGPAA